MTTLMSFTYNKLNVSDTLTTAKKLTVNKARVIAYYADPSTINTNLIEYNGEGQLQAKVDHIHCGTITEYVNVPYLSLAVTEKDGEALSLTVNLVMASVVSIEETAAGKARITYVRSIVAGNPDFSSVVTSLSYDNVLVALVAAAGTVTLTTGSFANGTAAAPSITFTSDTDTGFYRVGANTIGVASNGALDFQFAANVFTALSGSSIATNTISETTAASGVTVDGALIKDGGLSANSQIAAFYPAVAQNDIAAGTGGAIPVTNYLTTINTDAGGDAFTLADGAQIGQMKKIQLVADGGGDGVVTPATAFAGGAAATFDDAGDFLILQWSGAAWVVIENSGVTIA